MQLTNIRFTPKTVVKGMDVLRQMKSLQTIATSVDAKDAFPASEFWKKYDAGAFK
jgi:hypothetical protein